MDETTPSSVGIGHVKAKLTFVKHLIESHVPGEMHRRILIQKIGDLVRLAANHGFREGCEKTVPLILETLRKEWASAAEQMLNRPSNLFGDKR